MSYKCENCGKGRNYGHAVSHAKVRLGRTFKPNLQKFPVLISGFRTVGKLCASCIKRLKKDGRLGIYTLIKKAGKIKIDKIELPKIPEAAKVKAVEKAREKFDIESIVGKKS